MFFSADRIADIVVVGGGGGAPYDTRYDQFGETGSFENRSRNLQQESKSLVSVEEQRKDRKLRGFRTQQCYGTCESMSLKSGMNCVYKIYAHPPPSAPSGATCTNISDEM